MNGILLPIGRLLEAAWRRRLESIAVGGLNDEFHLRLDRPENEAIQVFVLVG